MLIDNLNGEYLNIEQASDAQLAALKADYQGNAAAYGPASFAADLAEIDAEIAHRAEHGYAYDQDIAPVASAWTESPFETAMASKYPAA